MLIRIAKNLARFVVTFLVATLAVFGIMRVLPGDPAAIAAGENATPELIAQLAKEFGTDRPLPEQYWDWFSGLLRGDFGVSYVTRTDISPLVLDKVQVSLILVTLAMLLALVIAIPLGILAAVRHGKPSGALVSGLSQLGIAIPGFLLGILLVSFVSLRLGWLPANGWTPPGVGLRRFPPAHHPAGDGPGRGAVRDPDALRALGGPGGHARGLPAHGPRQGALARAGAAQARPAQRRHPGADRDVASSSRR